MPVETLISVEEYLNSSYSPDMEYVDGQLVEINVGEWLHSLIQRNVIVALSVKYPHIWAVPELRSRTKPTRYRLPDVTVLLAEPETEVLLDAAFIAIEILSKKDRMTRVIERLKEFEANGTRHIWVVNPRTRQLFTFRSGDLLEVKGDLLFTESPRIELSRAEIFKSVR